MIIETISNPKHETEIKFGDLEPGTVFEFESGIKTLKLQDGKCVHLTFSDSDDWFILSDGSMEARRRITKVWGKLVGLKVQL